MSVHRMTAAGLAMLAAAAGALAMSTPAMAVHSRAVLTLEFGAFQFLGPVGDAVDQTNGNVFVDDTGSNVVRAFAANGGAPVGGTPATLEGEGAPSGLLNFNREPSGVAVDNSCFQRALSAGQCAADDPSNGDIYVTDVAASVVDKFRVNGSKYEYVCEIGGFGDTGGYTGPACLQNSSEGTFSGRFREPLGVAVDSQGDVYISNYGGEVSTPAIYEYNPAGEEVGVYASPQIRSPQGVAVDATGDIFVSEYEGARNVVELKRSSFTGPVEPAKETLLGSGAGDVAFDYATGALLVDYESRIVEYTLNGEKYEATSEVAEGLTGSQGLAINETTNEIYASNRSTGKVTVLSEPLFYATVATLPLTNVTQEGVALNGTVDPEEIPVIGCVFEYGPTPAYGSTAPCSPAPGAGNAPVAVSASVTGLRSNETYHYRIAASTKDGTRYGSDKEFHFLKTPSVNDLPAFASNLTPLSATLNGTVDPHNVPTAYHFVWGPTGTYGSVAPVPDLYTPLNNIDDTVVPQTLVGLQPGTTYHFALVASSAGGTVTGPDETFATPAIPPPTASTGAASEVTLGAATLTGTIDPESTDTTYHFEYGTSTAYGSDWPTVDVQAGQFDNPQPVTIALQNLQPGTTYHYRLVATNPAGTVYGADQTFTTPSYPVSIVAETPILKTPLGINPETKASSKTPVKHKHKKKTRKRARHRKKG